MNHRHTTTTGVPTVGTPVEPRQLDHEFKALCDAAGLRPIRFHDLRHSAASILIAQGVHPKAIQELVRHSSFQLTMDLRPSVR